MAKFILNSNQQLNGDYEVHDKTRGCNFMPDEKNQLDLGEHSDCRGAVSLAKRKFSSTRINGCYYCCNLCHTT